MFSVLHAVVLQDVANCTLNWVLQMLPKPNAVPHQAPRQSILLLGQEGTTQRLPCRVSQAGAPYPSPHRTPSGNETGPATVWPTIQHPLSPSLRLHLSSLYMPCTTPECWPDNTNLSVRVRLLGGTGGSPSHLGSPQSSLSLFIRWTPLQYKHIVRKEGEKLLHTRNQLCLPSLSVQKTFLTVLPQG